MPNDSKPTLAEEIADLTAPEDDLRRSPVDARKKAMDYLARREHTAGELIEKLVRARFEESVAADAVFELRKEGLQSDLRFAEAFVQSRYRQGKGPARIRQELRQKQVPDSLVADAFADFDGDWRALAVEVRDKKFGSLPPEDFQERAKQMRFLQYRGFEQEHIRVACGDDDV